jgi:hypothetical protein
MKSGVKLHVCVLDSIQSQMREVRALVNAHTLPKALLWCILGTKSAPSKQNKLKNRIPLDVREHIATFNTVQEEVGYHSATVPIVVLFVCGIRFGCGIHASS